jgi:ribonuclease D
MYETYRGLIRQLIKSFRRMALQKRVSNKQIARLPLYFYQGDIAYIKDARSASDAVNNLLMEKFLGFDTESKPAFTKGEAYLPSLIQLSGAEKVYVFKLNKIGGIVPLKPILENEKIVKVGVAVHHDVQNLLKIDRFEPRGFYDLGTFSRKLGIVHTGLRNLAAIFLRVRISKSLQLTDWSQEILTPQQILYAATDAWISREIFLRMMKFLP